jgi:hypothetical protein
MMPLAFLSFTTVAVLRAQNPMASRPVVRPLQQQLAWYMDRVAMTGFRVTSVLLFAMAARCLVLWLNARSFSAYRSVGLYLLTVSAVFATGTLAVAQPSSHPPASALDTPFLAENLGRAYVAIDGAWAFHPGDNLAWAAPGLDDSQWTRIQTGRTWEEQGFRNYTGYAWYRQRIVVDPQLNPRIHRNWKLVLYLPAVQNAAEVYWNGRLIGSYGKLPPDPVWYDAVWPLGVAIMCPACGRGNLCWGGQSPGCSRSGCGRLRMFFSARPTWVG